MRYARNRAAPNSMTETLEVGFLSWRDGGFDPAQPPNFLVAQAPKRAARGRTRDLLTVRLDLGTATGKAGPDPAPYLMVAHDQFFGTSGSVTAAARTAVEAVNVELIRLQGEDAAAALNGSITCSVLRDDEFFIIQSGAGQSFVLHSDNVERFPEPGRSLQPLGLASGAELHYFHTKLAAGDLVLLCRAAPSGWRLPILRAMAGEEVGSILARLNNLARENTTALVGCYAGAEQFGRLTDAIELLQTAPEAMLSEINLQSAGALPLAAVQPASATKPAAPANIGETLAELLDRMRHQQPAGVSDPVPAALANVLGDGLPAATQADAHARDAADADEAEYGPATPAGPDPLPQWAEAEKTAALRDAGIPTVAEYTRDYGGADDQIDDDDDDELLPQRPRVAEYAAAWLRAATQWFANLPLAAARDQFDRGLKSLGTSVGGASRRLAGRMLPEQDSEPEFSVSQSTLAAIAIATPALIVLLTTTIYIQLGITRQFRTYMDGAQFAAAQARTAADAFTAAPSWKTALEQLDQADLLRPGDAEAAQLRTEARAKLDQLSKVARLPVTDITPRGFPEQGRITHLLALGSPLYALDAQTNSIYRAVQTAGGYQLDEGFKCSAGSINDVAVTTLVDMALLENPNFLNKEAIAALDPTGKLLICPGDNTPAHILPLAPPETGWSAPGAFALFSNRLYILDATGGQIWIYNDVSHMGATGAAEDPAKQPPLPLFGAQPIALQDVVDFTLAQGDIFLLHRDGHLTHCIRQTASNDPICTQARFQDDRPGHASGPQLTDLVGPAAILFFPPPEAAFYFVDTGLAGAIQASPSLAVQREIRPQLEPNQNLTAFGLGAGRQLLFAAGPRIFAAQRP